jgi:hypothetical protein
MSTATTETGPGDCGGRRWFVILAIVTLVGFSLFVGAVTVLAVRIPELKKPKLGVRELGGRSA